jgi:hypothetical protein
MRAVRASSPPRTPSRWSATTSSRRKGPEGQCLSSSRVGTTCVSDTHVSTMVCRSGGNGCTARWPDSPRPAHVYLTQITPAAPHGKLMVVASRARQSLNGRNGSPPGVFLCRLRQRRSLPAADPTRRKKSTGSAGCTSLLRRSCSPSARRRSDSCSMSSWTETSVPRTGRSIFHRPMELGWTPYSLAIWAGVLSRVSASSTT